jgi:hypothetical protein
MALQPTANFRIPSSDANHTVLSSAKRMLSLEADPSALYKDTRLREDIDTS